MRSQDTLNKTGISIWKRWLIISGRIFFFFIVSLTLLVFLLYVYKRLSLFSIVTSLINLSLYNIVWCSSLVNHGLYYNLFILTFSILIWYQSGFSCLSFCFISFFVFYFLIFFNKKQKKKKISNDFVILNVCFLICWFIAITICLIIMYDYLSLIAALGLSRLFS